MIVKLKENKKTRKDRDRLGKHICSFPRKALRVYHAKSIIYIETCISAVRQYIMMRSPRRHLSCPINHRQTRSFAPPPKGLTCTVNLCKEVQH
jgi:hypothetical protein